MRSRSISGRLTLIVLLLEIAAALTLVALVTNHERRVQFETLDANVRATANALLGSIQEADTKDGGIRLDLHGATVPASSVYRVVADGKEVLGEVGQVPIIPSAYGTMTKLWVGERPYRFYSLRGERIVDPGGSDEVNHVVTVLYGVPEGNTWHEVFEATRYFAIATLLLLGVTALLMTVLIRRFLTPINDLALEAEKISANHWSFSAPASSKSLRELAPLAIALERTILRLEEAFEQQRRFTSDAAHELKTDVAIIKSSVQLLCMKRRTVEEYQCGLALGLTDIARMESTVSRMLTLARLEQQSIERAEIHDVKHSLEAAVNQCIPFASLKEVQVLLSALPSSADVRINENEAILLYSNILMNALQHSPRGGIVNIDLTLQENDVVTRFFDQGDGVSDEDLPHLFEPYYRGDASRSRESGGSGLGLSICKAICDRTGGGIVISNYNDGCGAQVIITLPRQPSRPT